MTAKRIPYRDRIGNKIGHLTVLEYIPGKDNKIERINPGYLCLCKCGKKITASCCDVVSGQQKGCRDCYNERRGALSTTHGMRNTSEYTSWASMRQRCNNKNSKDFHHYGGREVPITVCKRWDDSFIDFYADMGDKPTPKHTLERVNNNGNYEPGNCIWETRRAQALNTRRECSPSIDTSCAICGCKLNRRARDYIKGGNYCLKHMAQARRTGKIIKCLACKKDMWVQKCSLKRKKYCSRQCLLTKNQSKIYENNHT